MSTQTTIFDHYVPDKTLRQLIETRLQSSGLNLSCLSLSDLAPLDEFHIGGRSATLELLESIQWSDQHHVLDIGCGLGGPSRTLADTSHCQVTGIDLMESYCTIANYLCSLVKMKNQVDYCCANAQNLPFPDNFFDGVWSQHMIMNIEDKEVLCREVHRVLKCDGSWILYENFTGPDGPVYLPVPWASNQNMNHLVRPEQMVSYFQACHFSIETWQEVTEQAIHWFQSSGPGNNQNSVNIGLDFIFGPEIQKRGKNVFKSLQENRLKVFKGIVKKVP